MLIYVDDPEERKRSLDSRSTSIDALEQFRAQHIDRVLQGTAVLTESDAKAICAKAQEDLDQGILTKEQCLTVIKQVIQVSFKITILSYFKNFLKIILI